MAAMTKSSDITPFISGLGPNGVTVVRISDTGADLTTIAAKVASKRHVIVGGSVSFAAAAVLEIYSEARLIDSVELPGAGTQVLPFGLECNTNENLALKNPDGGALTGWIAYKTIVDGETIPTLLRR